MSDAAKIHDQSKAERKEVSGSAAHGVQVIATDKLSYIPPSGVSIHNIDGVLSEIPGMLAMANQLPR